MASTQDQKSAFLRDDFVPLEEKYESRDALSCAFNVWIMTRGYVSITGRPTKDEAGRQTITLICGRRHNYPINLQRRRLEVNTKTISCELLVLDKGTPIRLHCFYVTVLLNDSCYELCVEKSASF